MAMTRTIFVYKVPPYHYATADQSVFISDINIDCLEHIFQHLTANDLLNVAHTSKLMKIGAELVIKKKLKTIWVSLFYRLTSKDKAIVYCEDNVLKITRPKHGLRFLRCFGHSILKMNVSLVSFNEYYDFSVKLKYFDKVKELFYEYLFKYCADSLIEIEFSIKDITVLRNLRNENWKPFSNAEKVYFKNCNLDNRLISFNELFPKLRCLDFLNLRDSHYRGNKLTNWRCISERFNNLQHLSVGISETSEGAREEYVLTALKLNPKLRSLSLRFGCERYDRSINDFIPVVFSPEFFPLLCKRAECLETLQIKFFDCSPLLQHHGQIIHFKCLKNLELELDGFHKTPFPSKIPFTSDTLECFNLVLGLLSEKALAFIKYNPEITNISFKNYSPDGRYYEDETIMDALSFRCKYKLSADEAISFLNKCKSLKSFVFVITTYSEYIRFKQLMEISWNIEYQSYNRLYSSNHTITCLKLD